MIPRPCQSTVARHVNWRIDCDQLTIDKLTSLVSNYNFDITAKVDYMDCRQLKGLACGAGSYAHSGTAAGYLSVSNEPNALCF